MTQINDKIIVIDELTHGILCESVTPTIAYSVSLGFINSSIKILAASLPWFEHTYDHDYNDINVHYEFRKMEIFPLNIHLIDDEYLRIRQLAVMRNMAHRSWEVKCKQYLQNRNHDYHGMDMLGGFLSSQLDKCDPKNNYYTQAIYEWATISEVSVATAYQELKIKSESIGLQYLRNHAIYQKYVNLINKCTIQSEFKDIILDGKDQLVIGRSLI